MQVNQILTEAPKKLETPRLIIRIDTEETYCQAFQELSEAELKARFGILNDEELNAQKAKVAGGFTNYRTALLFFHLKEKESNAVIGSFAYHNWYPAHRRSEIGYAMNAEQHKNKGYMKEALPLMIRYGFDVMDLNRMEAFIHPDNIPSRKLVEATGFQQEGLLKEHYYHNGVVGDSLVYGLLRREYKKWSP